MTEVGASSAEDLRDRLVGGLLADGRIVSPAVEAAFRVVPRHVFAPTSRSRPGRG